MKKCSGNHLLETYTKNVEHCKRHRQFYNVEQAGFPSIDFELLRSHGSCITKDQVQNHFFFRNNALIYNINNELNNFFNYEQVQNEGPNYEQKKNKNCK